MKLKTIRLSQRYLTGLRSYLKPGAHVGLQTARDIGRRAVMVGVETLELARIHEHALKLLKSSKTSVPPRAEIFFTEANSAIEKNHRTARQNQVSLSQMEELLDQRGRELAASNRQVQRVVIHRRSIEAAAAKCGKAHSRSLEESLELQTRLRQLTHRVLATQEDERSKISRELQNEIAQTLLGINVRLLSLKNEARSTTKGFHDEITSTQQLVLKSAKFVRRSPAN